MILRIKCIPFKKDIYKGYGFLEKCVFFFNCVAFLYGNWAIANRSWKDMIVNDIV